MCDCKAEFPAITQLIYYYYCIIINVENSCAG